eukprot:TRINITY_DN6606_c0_g1_i1.p2 TRINITY_DN6606_c0_g1~~TRINITY_DN6606_c0_g1_i1.p2  ORF type:complete len:276 (+),score=46.57 TRINITY_DN6606_c0_g1_i1:26-829(+)
MRTGFLLLLFVIVNSQVLLEVSFDISSRDATGDGYKAADSVTSYLQSTRLQWLRYFHVLISDQTYDVPMRVANLMFKNISAWAAFEDEQLARTHILHDIFWVNSRRVLWNVGLLESYPIRENLRTATTPGGFVWRLQFSVPAEKKKDWERFWATHIPTIIATQLQPEGSGFIEAFQFQGQHLRNHMQELLCWEFLDMKSLVSVVFSAPVQTFLSGLEGYTTDYFTTILAPPVDTQSGLFWQAQGNDDKAEKVDDSELPPASLSTNDL